MRTKVGELMLKLATDPKRMLLLDAIGALATALTTYYLLAGERIQTGLPTKLLQSMASVAACFACFDLLSVRLFNNLSIPLRIIAATNLLYVVASIGALIAYRELITALGVAYFSLEAAIIIPLALWEWTLGSK